MGTRRTKGGTGRKVGEEAAPGRADRGRELVPGEPLRIRKYANRRLYDQSASRHLTAEELYGLVVAGHDVVVTDATTEEDITNIVLAQLLIERDPLKLAAVPSPVLHALIRTNERMLQSAITRHLTAMLESMAQLQRQAQAGFPTAMTPFGPLAPTAIDPASASMEWMRRLMGGTGGGTGPAMAPTRRSSSEHGGAAEPASADDDLRDELADLKRQIAELRGRTGGRKGGRKGAPQKKAQTKPQKKTKVNPDESVSRRRPPRRSP